MIMQKRYGLRPAPYSRASSSCSARDDGGPTPGGAIGGVRTLASASRPRTRADDIALCGHGQRHGVQRDGRRRPGRDHRHHDDRGPPHTSQRYGVNCQHDENQYSQRTTPTKAARGVAGAGRHFHPFVTPRECGITEDMPPENEPTLEGNAPGQGATYARARASTALPTTRASRLRRWAASRACTRHATCHGRPRRRGQQAPAARASGRQGEPPRTLPHGHSTHQTATASTSSEGIVEGRIAREEHGDGLATT